MEYTQQFKSSRFDLSDKIDDRTFNAVIGFVVCSGFLINYLMATFFKEQILAISPILILILYILGTIGCTIGIYKSKSPIISYALFILLSFFMGLLLVYYVSFYTDADIKTAFMITLAVTVVMLALACAYPKFFLSIGRGLFIAFVSVFLVELVFRLIIGFQMDAIDIVVAGIFSLYIGYDWAKAQQYPKTIDNAVDSAADIYVDIAILFVRILSIIGDRE